MRPTMISLTLLAALALAGCVEPEDGTYPLTGEECTAGDPVQDISGDDCISPTGTGI